jgi:Ca2+-binding EF-hand superfamily protein
MKKLLMIAVLACVAMATDYSKMSTEQLMNMRGKVDVNERPAFQQEMQKRMQSMTPDQRQDYMKSNRNICMKKNKMKMPTFDDVDTNKNGMISRVEFQKHQAGQMQNMRRYNNNCTMMGMGRKSMMNMPKFSDFDINNDGYMTESELQEARNKRMIQNAKEGKMMKNVNNAPSFADMDSDKNGKVSPEEFQKHQMGQMQMQRSKY